MEATAFGGSSSVLPVLVFGVVMMAFAALLRVEPAHAQHGQQPHGPVEPRRVMRHEPGAQRGVSGEKGVKHDDGP